MSEINYSMKDLKRFWTKVNVPDDLSECWEWQAAIKQNGYGYFSLNGKMYHAQRMAYWFTYGENPGDLCVCHSCDNPACCNPVHLWLGTQRENMRDMRFKERGHPLEVKRGEDHKMAKLTQLQVDEIRQKYAEGNTSHRTLAREYGVVKSMISNIVNWRNWK